MNGATRPIFLFLVCSLFVLVSSGCVEPDGDEIEAPENAVADGESDGDRDDDGDDEEEEDEEPLPDPWPEPEAVDLSDNPRGATFDFSLGGEHTRLFALASGLDVGAVSRPQDYYEQFADQFAEISSEFSEDGETVVVLPGGLELVAGFVGSRGEAARQASTLEEARALLRASYAAVIGELETQFGDLSEEHLLELALTDIRWRTVGESFSLLAAMHGVWLLATLELPELESRSEPETVALWADPQTSAENVFVPTSAELWETTLVFDPSGDLVEIVRGQGRDSEEGQWIELRPPENILPISVAELAVGILPRAALWMPPLLDRVTTTGVHLLVYPAVFEGWASEVTRGDTVWTPEMVSSVLWTAVQRNPEIRYAAVAPKVGNVFDRSFDGQPAIFTQAYANTTVEKFIGQQLRAGKSNIGPWSFLDPGESDGSLSQEVRRQLLVQLGEGLLPGSGGEFEDGQVRGAVGRTLTRVFEPYVVDVDESIDAPEGVKWTERIIRPLMPWEDSPFGPRQNLRIDIWGDDLLINFAARRGEDPDRNLRAESRRKTWNASEELYEWSGSSGTGGGLAVIPFVQKVFKGTRETMGYSQIVGPDFSAVNFHWSEGTDYSTMGDPFPNFHDLWEPRLSRGNDRVIFTFSDGGSGNDRVHYTTSDLRMSWTNIRAVEPESAFEQGDVRANQWSPTADINASSLAVAWSDFRNGYWDIYGAHLISGQGFSEPRRISFEDKGWRLHDEPEIQLLSHDQALVVWTARTQENTAAHILARQWDLSSNTLGPVLELSWPGAHASWAPRVDAREGDIAVTWTELRGDRTVIVADRFDGRGGRAISHPDLVLWESDVSVLEDRVVVVWSEYHPEVGYGFRVAHLE